ncbi:amino acid adenylation domain-containing protein [Lentzea sp. NPDC058436]|uniref:amino acid adenylation domain-containing protein n=1 Tax=Lentzea sp. NPDC058436 TaxID=3346499 RepID=UPI003649E6FD
MGLFESFQALGQAQQAAFARRALADEDLAAAVLPSAAQERIIVLSAIEGGAATYTLPWAGRVVGGLDTDALQEAFGVLLQRHEQLRRRFVLAGDRLLALESDETPAVEHHTCPGLGADARDHDARARASADAARPFEVIGGPLARLGTVEYAADDHLVLLTLNHAVADGWSLDVVYRELSDLYAAVVAGGPVPPPDPSAGEYSDYVRAERRAATDGSRDAALRRWAEVLADAPAGIELPVDLPRPRTQSFEGANAERVLSAATSRAIRSLGAATGATPFMTCLTLFGHALSRYAGDRDIVVGTPVAGRPSADFDDVVGMFVNTIPIRLRIERSDSLRESVARVRAACLEAFDGQDVPLDALVDRLVVRQDLSRPPLFQVSFAYAAADGEAAPPVLGEATVRPVDVAGTTAKFELSLTVHEDADGRLRAVLEYARALFDPRTAERILTAFEAVAALAGDPGSDTRTAAFAPSAVPQRPQELAPARWDDPATVLELVTTAAQASPAAIAIRYDDEEYTYERLLTDVRGLAGVLTAHGVGPGARVGVLLDRTPRLVVSMLAVLAAGGAYVPLDPGYPAPRLSFMIEDSGCVAVIASGAEVPGLATAVPVLSPDVLPAEPVHPPVPATGPADEAYVLYTSGSTGVPKGVSIPHRAVLAMVRGTWQLFGTDCLRESLAATSVSFDVSTVELYPPLGLGGTVHLARSLFEPPTGDVRPTFTAGVPSLLGAAVEGGTLDVTGMVVAAGGEPLRAELVRRLHAAGAARVVNIYGPSEDCTYSTSAVISPASDHPQIGQSVPGSRAYVLDPDGFALPHGAIGEICLAGTGLADGYVRRPALTAARFVPDPFSAEPGARMYRTGDLGRFRPDGELEYAGRLDRQVKINGMRIELGEVESALSQVDGVTHCAAVVQDGGGHARLAAVVQGRAAIDVKAVRRTLQNTLPRHLIPTAMVQVEQIPHLPNGKVDTTAVLAALPALPTAADPAPAVVPEPDSGPAAETIRRLWSKILPGSDGRGDFFAAGGNSLSALRLALLVRDEFAVPFGIADVFATRTAAEMALFVERPTTPLPATAHVAADDERRTGLSREQFRLWYLELIDDAGSAYVIAMGWRLTGPLDVQALTKAFERLQDTHAALRFRIRSVDGMPQTFDGGTNELRLTEGRADDAWIADRFAEVGSARFDLDGGPLCTGELVALAPQDHLLLISAHHVVLDGWSVGILEEDLSALYAEFAGGGGKPLEPAGADYRDHVVGQAERLASPRTTEDVETWRRLLQDAPTVLPLPRDRSAPDRAFLGSSERFALSTSTTEALQGLADDFALTPFMVSSLVFGLTLMELANVDDVVMGTPVSGRYDRAFERTVGMFVNTIVVRVDGRGNPATTELVRRYKAFSEAAYSHQDVPFDLVVEAVRPVRSPLHSPLFQVLFSYDYGFGGGLTLPGVDVRALDDPGSSSKFDLSAVVGGEHHDFDHLTLEYSTDLFGPDDVRRLARRFEAVAVSLARDHDLTVDDHLERSP